MSAQLAAVASVVPQGMTHDEFFRRLEAVQTNVQIAGQSYSGLLEAAEKASDARKSLAYFVVTASIGLLTAYFTMLVKSVDPTVEIMRHFLPAVGIALCYVVMIIGNSRYVEECKFTAQALRVEDDKGIRDGAAATRASILQYGSFWVPSRDHLATFCTAMPWLITAIVEAWYSV